VTVRILTGDCREVLATLPAGSVHCVVTSPPYFGLRSYLPDGHDDKAAELGAEPTPDAYVAALVAVMGECRRVLRDDGVAWVVLGDSFGGGGRCGSDKALAGKQGTNRGSGAMIGAPTPGEPGNLLLIPARVALALQADGWTLRQVVTWAKVAPMPESVAGTRWERCRVKVAARWDDDHPHPSKWAAGDQRASFGEHSGYQYRAAEYAPCPGCPRCASTGGYVLRRGSWRHTSATEQVLMLTKGMAYWADQEAVREANSETSHGGGQMGRERNRGGRTDGFTKAPSNMPENPAGRNPRNWVTPSPSPFPGAHFATYPPALIEPLIKATCPARCCPTCGAGWAVVKDDDECYNSGHGIPLQRVQSDAGSDGFRDGQPEAGWTAPDVPGMRQGVTEGAGNGRPGGNAAPTSGVTLAAYRDGTGTGAGIQPHRGRTGEVEGGGRTLQGEGRKTGSDPRQGFPMAQNRKGPDCPADVVQSASGADDGGAGSVHGGGLDGDACPAGEPLPILQRGLFGDVAADNRPRDPDFEGRGAFPGEHRRGVPAVQFQEVDQRPARILTYRPTCQCGREDPVPGVCLDPFAGAGTTLLVADRLGLDAIGIELNPDYADMARDRVTADAPLFTAVAP